MASDKDHPIKPSFEEAETQFNDFILIAVPPNGFREAQRHYTDGMRSANSLCSVVGAGALTLSRRDVARDVIDTRLDFAAIVKDLK